MLRLITHFALVVALACQVLTASPTRGADYFPEVMFILDSSGSMSESVDGNVKIDVAKRVMREIVPELNENVRVGLTAYGHRSAGDCSDIEVLLPPGSDDRDELLAQVQQLKPTGRTPISAAILTVTDRLKFNDAETTIVLVSDGIETCGGDPCAVVTQLQATGVKFVLHVVGFDVDDAAREQLECTAGAGGGRYFDATDGDALLSALKEVTAEVAEKVQQVDPARVKLLKQTTGLGKLRVRMPEGSEVSLASLTIEEAGSDKVVRTAKKPASDKTYPLKAGKYRIVLDFATPSFGRPTRSDLGVVEIRKGETKELSLGSLSFNVADLLAQKAPVEEVHVVEAGTDNVLVTVRKNGNRYYHYKPKPIPAGIYNVRFRYSYGPEGGSEVSHHVVVEPYKDSVVTLDSGFQLQEADDVIGWWLVEKTEAQQESEDGATSEDQPIVKIIREGFVNRSALWAPYIVPSGTYDLHVLIDGMDEALVAGEAIEIKAGDFVQFDAGL